MQQGAGQGDKKEKRKALINMPAPYGNNLKDLIW